ncbi:MAG TPA: hypothetical protein VFV46_04330 [Lacibacter sp.]|nr:hypothetical protein [Lacibacter sp.]
MPQPQVYYTLVTATGDRNMKCPNAHDDYDNIEQWLKANFPSFTTAADTTDKASQVKEVYKGHNRSGQKVY